MATVLSVARRSMDLLLGAGHWFTCPYCKGFGGPKERIHGRDAFATVEAHDAEWNHQWNRLRWQGFCPTGYRVVVGGKVVIDKRDISGRAVVGGRIIKRHKYKSDIQRKQPSLARAYARPFDGDFSR